MRSHDDNTGRRLVGARHRNLALGSGSAAISIIISVVVRVSGFVRVVARCKTGGRRSLVRYVLVDCSLVFTNFTRSWLITAAIMGISGRRLIRY